MRLAVVLVLASGCGRVDFDGMYANGLVVSTTMDRLAGPPNAASLADLDPGLTDLSLREALTIAGNNAEPTRIVFDARMFRPGGTATIMLDTPLPAIAGNGIDLDARGAGVTLDGTAAPLIELGGSNNRVLGLAFLGTGTRIHVNARIGVVSGCSFSGGGIAIDGQGTGLQIDANKIDGGSAEGIRLKNVTDSGVTSNRITATASDPINVTASSDVAIYANNIVIGDKNAGSGIVVNMVNRPRIVSNIVDPGSARLVAVYDSPDAEVIGNILDRGDVGVLLSGTSTNAYVFRNVVIMPANEPMYIATTATGARVINNTLYMSGTIADGSPNTVEANTLDADTGFVAPEKYDFRLVAGNPAIDAGMDVGQDMLGNGSRRFLGAAPDLGAVESY